MGGRCVRPPAAAPGDYFRATQDFVFGTLSTTDEVLRRAQTEGRAVSHRWRTHPPVPRPDEPVELVVDLGEDAPNQEVRCHFTTDGSSPSETSPSVPFREVSSRWSRLLWSYLTEWRGVLPAQPAGTLVRYRIVASGGGRAPAWADGAFADSGPATSFSFVVDGQAAPRWARAARIYHLMVDRFARDDGRPLAPDGEFAGGTLRGVMSKLDYLAELGFNAIWLSPIWESDTHHGYDVRDYRRVAARFGSNQDFRDLVGAAHERGLRVILDYVPSHGSHRHPYFVDARLQGSASPYFEWFTFFAWPDEYKSFFGVETLPQWNLEYPATRQYLIDCARAWVEDFGVDGLRLDHALGPSLDFWTTFRSALKQTDPDVFLFGEAVDGSDVLARYQGRLDGCLDFLFLQRVRQLLAFGTLGAPAFVAFLDAHERYFEPGFVRPTFLDNHDMNRFLWLVDDPRRLELAALLQYTLPQPPIVYYGTEVGLSQTQDVMDASGRSRHAVARAPMPWGAEPVPALREVYRGLNRLRATHPALAHGPRSTLYADRDGGLAYQLGGGDEALLVVLNTAPEPRRLRVPGGSLAGFGRLQDPRTGAEALVRAGGVELTLGPYAGVVLAPEAARL